MNGEIWKALMFEATKVFGPVSTWDAATKREVAAWTKRTVDGICGGTVEPPRAAPPQSWYEPVGRWDDVEKI